MPVSTTHKRILFVTVLGLGLVACDSDDSSASEDDQPSTAAASSESGGGSERSAEPAGGMSAPPEGQQELKLGGQGDKQGQQAMMKKRIEMMKKRAKIKEKAFEAAETAEAEGDTPCEKAFHAALAVDDSMRQQLGKKPTGAEPSKQQFVSTCKSLPGGMQQCLVPSYARGNQQECSKAHKGAKPETKETLQQLMTQLRGG